MSKLASRKFWVCIAALLGSLGTGVTGLAVGNETLAMTGGILTVVSGAIYAACEAYVDGASLKANTTTTVENTSIQVQSSTGKDVDITKAAAAKLAPAETPAPPAESTPEPAPVEAGK